MITWMKRLRGAVVLALTWAVAWAVGGILIGASSIVLPWLPWDAFFRVFDAPLPALAIPGFVGGLIFSAVLGVAEHRRQFEELSAARFAAWGALGGLLLTLIPASAVLLGSATVVEGAHELWPLTLILVVPLTALSAASASGSLWLAKRSDTTHALPPADDVADLWLADGQAQDLIARAD